VNVSKLLANKTLINSCNVKPDFQHMTDADVISVTAKQNKEEESKEDRNGECCVTAWHSVNGPMEL
jgi:hypothetical protein